MGRKLRDYWRDKNNLIYELQSIVENLGDFPTVKYLLSNGKNDLVRAIYNHHGGINVVREKMGFKAIQKSTGYWDKWENLVIELQPIIDELGDFPSSTYLRSIGRSDISGAIHKYHGGFPVVIVKMGFELKERPKHYWEDEKNLIKELQPIIDNLGDFPSEYYLRLIGRSDLSNAIYNYYGGFPVIREKTGFKLKQKRSGYWKEWENIRNELQPIIDELGDFPYDAYLKSIGRSDLVNAIKKYHGGFPVVREKMGFDVIKKSDNYWRDEKNLINELQPIIDNLGDFPVQSYLYSIGRSDISNAIIRFHGGFPVLREKMGFEVIKKSDHYWEDKNNLISELQPIIDDSGGFPTDNYLDSIGRSDISNAIMRYHGGFPAARKIMGFPPFDISSIRKYIVNRGYKTQKLVLEIIKEYCKINSISVYTNKKLSKGNVIELVCQTDKKIGIDVTNSKTKSSIEVKWTKKDYHKYLDELWIVVVSTTFKEEQYQRWNKESPDNVFIYHWAKLESEKEMNISSELRIKLNTLAKCTYQSKDYLIADYSKQQSLDNFVNGFVCDSESDRKFEEMR